MEKNEFYLMARKLFGMSHRNALKAWEFWQKLKRGDKKAQLQYERDFLIITKCTIEDFRII